MPELPEVETITCQLQNITTGRTIQRIEVIDSRLGLGNDFEKIKNKKILSVARRGKYIVFALEKGINLVIHLRMTGRLLWQEVELNRTRHTRAVVYLGPKSKKGSGQKSGWLLFDDLRRFGVIRIDNKLLVLDKLGPEPVGPGFNLSYLKNKLKNSKMEIKDFLLDQGKIAGIGNIYASEILFAAGIHPRRKACSLHGSEIGKLFRQTRRILKAAIRHQGTTFSRYADTRGRKGSFQPLLKVYRREGQLCRLCRCSVRRIKQHGRSTFFCDKCQH